METTIEVLFSLQKICQLFEIVIWKDQVLETFLYKALLLLFWLSLFINLFLYVFFFVYSAFSFINFLGGGWNVEFHYYDWPFFSLHRKWLFSWSLLRHHYIENGFLVDHYYNITTTTKKDFWRCDFTYGIKKDHNVENQKYLFKQLPVAYYLWIPRPVGPWGVWLGSIRLG